MEGGSLGRPFLQNYPFLGEPLALGLAMPYLLHMATTQTPTYWVTGKGNHRHFSHTCANQRRAITTGDPQVAPLDDERPLCEHCTPTELLAAQSKAAPLERPWCSNSAAEQPRQYRSHCTDCGQGGLVMRNGKLKSHRVRQPR